MTEIKDLGYRESLEGLPQELLDSLTITKINPLDKELLEIIKSFDGIATLDEIVIRHYRRTNKVVRRSLINNRLLALVKKHYLSKKAGQKGVYEIVEKQQTDNSFSVDDDIPF